jgi:Immunity protein 63
MWAMDRVNDEVQRLRSIMEGQAVDWYDLSIDHDFGACHVEIDSQYHWISVERGKEFNRQTTDNVDDLLYWILANRAVANAMRWELDHRHPNDDFRRHYFARTVELLARVNLDWAVRQQAQWDEILTRHPFRDGDGTAAAAQAHYERARAAQAAQKQMQRPSGWITRLWQQLRGD